MFIPIPHGCVDIFARFDPPQGPGDVKILEAVFPLVFHGAVEGHGAVGVVEVDGEACLRDFWRWICCGLPVCCGPATMLREVAEYCEGLGCFDQEHLVVEFHPGEKRLFEGRKREGKGGGGGVGVGVGGGVGART